MRIIVVLLFFFCFFTACGEKKDHKGKTPLVEVEGEYLYREDLQVVLPAHLSKEDSLLFAEHYIKNWVEGVLLFDKAKRNIPDNENINQLVTNYREALILHAYQQELIGQKLSKEITDQEIADYYEKNKSLFILEQPLVKGLFVKVPLKVKGLNNVRNWYKKNTPQAIDQLEKYSLQNAVIYDYFYDRWLPISDVFDKIPLIVSHPDSYLNEHRHIELKDTAYHYFLHVEEYLPAGEQKPMEFAKAQVKDMLINLKRVEFMQGVKKDLYQKAVDRKKINYFY